MKFAAVLAITLVVAACDTPEERAQAHFERGLALIADDQNDKAGLEFRNALRLNRDFPEARFELGKLQERLGNFSAAAAHYTAALDLAPENAEAHLRLGQIVLLSGDVERAAVHIGEAARLNPDDASARAANAALMVRRGALDDAEAEANVAISLDPDNSSAHAVIASVLMERGDMEGALARVDAQLEATPNELSFHLIRLRILERMGDVDGVGAQLARQVEQFPDQIQFLQALARWRQQQGDDEGVEEVLGRMAEIEGEEGISRLVAFIAQRRGEEAALNELQSRIASAPDLAATYALRQTLADFQIATGRPDDARNTLDAIVAAENAPREAVNDARLRLARMAIQDGDAATALALAETVLAEDAENSDALAVRAAVAIDALRPEDAIADLRVALQGDPQNAQLMLLQAEAHERAGDLSAAAERFAAAARASNFDPEIAIRYARYLRAQGQLSAAEAAVSESTRRNPTSRAAWSTLAELRLLQSDWVGAEEAAAALRQLRGGEALAAQVSAASLTAQGRLDESTELLESSLDADKANIAVVSRLIRNYVQSGEIERAAAFLDEMLAVRPDDVAALLLRADLHAVQGQADQARALVERVIAIAPGSPAGHIALTRLNIAEGRLDEAERAAAVGIDAVENDFRLRLLQAQLLERRGAFEEAIAQYRVLAEMDPGSVLVANNLASLIAEHRSDDEEAMALAERMARRLRGYDIPELKDTYGWILFLRGDVAAALSPLIDAAAALPDNPIVRYHLGRAYAALDQKELAREQLEAALSLDADFPKAGSARDALAGLDVAK
jgi:tetratricopeptide (TPR) repeat protein